MSYRTLINSRGVRMAAKERPPRQEKPNRLTAAARLKAIADIIDIVEQRCLAVDGPVLSTRGEMSNHELQQIYRLAKGRE